MEIQKRCESFLGFIKSLISSFSSLFYFVNFSNIFFNNFAKLKDDIVFMPLSCFLHRIFS